MADPISSQAQPEEAIWVSIPVWAESRRPIPPNTASAARAAYGPANPYLLAGDQLGRLLDELGRGGLRNASLDGLQGGDLILAIVTVFQYVERLPDRLAADAVRTRLDWKYALHLPLDHPGIGHLWLGEFRHRLLDRETKLLAFQCVLDWLTAIGFLGSERQRPEATHVLRTVDDINCVQESTEAMSQMLEAVASLDPDWLRQIALPHWYQRYGRASPGSAQASLEGTSAPLLDAIRGDVSYLLEVAHRVGAPELETLPEMHALQELWHHRFEPLDDLRHDAGRGCTGRQDETPPEGSR